MTFLKVDAISPALPRLVITALMVREVGVTENLQVPGAQRNAPSRCDRSLHQPGGVWFELAGCMRRATFGVPENELRRRVSGGRSVVLPIACLPFRDPEEPPDRPPLPLLKPFRTPEKLSRACRPRRNPAASSGVELPAGRSSLLDRQPFLQCATHRRCERSRT